MSRLSIFLDTLLPNRAWRQRANSASGSARLLYWALRIGLTLAIVFLLYFFGVQQHPALR